MHIERQKLAKESLDLTNLWVKEPQLTFEFDDGKYNNLQDPDGSPKKSYYYMGRQS